MRRVVLGDAARDGQGLTDLLARLRGDANWAFLRPKRGGLRDRFDERLNSHLARAESGSLAGMVATTPTTADSAPAQQVPPGHFAFEPAGMAAFRALARLAAHPERAERARAESRDRDGSGWQNLPCLRACVLKSLRLWPTTPMVLRRTTDATTWDGAAMPERTGLLIVAPYLDRDERSLPAADRFAPELWRGDCSAADCRLIPFIGGPAVCPGQNLVLLLTGAMLAALLRRTLIRFAPPTRLDPRRPLPVTLNT